MKLSPNVTDITEIARAAEGAGADSVSLINTLLGMAIDAEKDAPYSLPLQAVCQEQQSNPLPCAWYGKLPKQ